ncbi:HPP family protein [Candidatus Coxiella mudrowiae]|uniref:HPP family protein n=1 Tax=Candidatus Coxiella mudrowiae TaxID=2054173 RepID=UPI001F298C25|nr:hypothetical protein [Candidatus Coxiella mudrowiae]
MVLIKLNKIARGKIIWVADESTLALSTFLVFCVPNSVVAKPLKIIGGYIIAMLVGEAMPFVC